MSSAEVTQLREALRMASTNVPTAAQLEALALKVGAVSAAGAAAGVASHSGWFSGQLGVAKVSVLLLVGAAAGWLGFRAVQQPSALYSAPQRTSAPAAYRQQAPTQPALTVQPTAAATHAAAAIAAVAPASSTAPVPQPVAAPTSPEPRASPASPIAAASAAAPAAVPSELGLLGQVQSSLARDPHAALDLVDEHARLYPHGAFSEEREALRIDALRRLGRSSEMRERALAFLDRYPQSPQREHIAAWLR